MAAPRRPEYDAPRFRQQWFSPVTLAEMAEEYGRSIPSIWLAAKNRNFPPKEIAKKMTDHEAIAAEFLRREQEASKTLQGQDSAAIIEELAHEYDMDSAVITEIVLDHTILGAC